MKGRNLLLGLLLGVLAAFWLFSFWIFFQPPADAPSAFLRRGRRPSTKKLVLCFGDSLTHARLSGDYIALLRDRFSARGYEFINAGINGHTTYDLLKRLDQVIACQPDYVTILIGTNDIFATEGNRAKMQYRLPYVPTLEQYRENYEHILSRLQAETSARIAILSLPPLGEDLDSAMNQRVMQYCAAIHDIAITHGVTYLPLHEELLALLDGHVARSTFTGAMMPILSAGTQRYLLGTSWNDIAAGQGLRLLTDYIHLNDRGAAVIAQLVAEFLD
ncbi:MAG: GDSL-type esterase/lipase family protein [Anaerolineae bacterium]